ncbi:hypothetical protein HETIRDRAFT_456674 [Heterobasidion irregulare TC 32-1]|uniref:RRM domain-containing protein n=1 Tax=Heterobasidion irregulare (strain TC 32-1) TaxID=747525 RepID=W4KN58_HETIT|nr:uncharacterized protein HETIRDRAFT_456674 [Heterobasidion irregulare TC 32-1]ETW86795.1 hypothetical protein HETIRDRAFT_456674 [Heterobasidion irregulare TC 32-1]
MSRHHPYGGNYDNSGFRRGGPSSGPGPDRSHRFHENGPPRGGRGFGRGRGRGSYGGGGYDAGGGHAAYDQAPPQGDMGLGGYNTYDSGSTQESSYQNGFGGPSPPQYGSPPASGGFEQNYGNFEGPNYGRGGPPAKRGVRRERDDKVHESIIEERIQRERPCRTLFIRNIKYETDSDDVRRQFEEHGEIKTFFDLIANRGMVFVTFFDLRAAERARERLQGSEISGRPIDVHYSLPRDDSNSKGGEKNQEMQGTLLVTLRNSISGQPIDDNEVRRKFQQFGDVKSVRPIGDRMDQRYVEFYDVRSAEDAFDRLRHQGLQDGVMDIVLAWEEGPPPGQPRNASTGAEAEAEVEVEAATGTMVISVDSPTGDAAAAAVEVEADPVATMKNESLTGNPENVSAPGGMTTITAAEAGANGYVSQSTPSAYNQAAPAPPVDERLDQARKVQQLLAALKQPQNGAGPSATPPVPQAAPAPMLNMPPPVPNYYAPPPQVMNQPPPMPYPGGMPPPNVPTFQPSNATQQPGPPGTGAPAPPGLAGLPPNILALLQNAQNQAMSGPPPQLQMPNQYGMPPPPPGPPMQRMPPQGMPGGPPPGVQMPPANTHGDFNQLLSYLTSVKRQ